jgi:hypothetical protein
MPAAAGRPPDERIRPAGNRADQQVQQRRTSHNATTRGDVRACSTRGCPGRMRGRGRCALCTRYPKGYARMERDFRAAGRWS